MGCKGSRVQISPPRPIISLSRDGIFRSRSIHACRQAPGSPRRAHPSAQLPCRRRRRHAARKPNTAARFRAMTGRPRGAPSSAPAGCTTRSRTAGSRSWERGTCTARCGAAVSGAAPPDPRRTAGLAERLRCANLRLKIVAVTGLLLWIAFGVLLGVAVSRRWRRLRVAARLNALTAADPPAEEFERERTRITAYRRGLAGAAALIGAVAGAALDALIGVIRLLGRG
jgi:hypothetical protein